MADIIYSDELADLGFTFCKNKYQEEKGWLGRISYDPTNNMANIVESEFCIISKKCETIEELKKFVEAVTFLCDLENK